MNTFQSQEINRIFPSPHSAICEPKISSPFPAQSTSDPATQSFKASRERASKNENTPKKSNVLVSSTQSDARQTKFRLYAHSWGVVLGGAGARPRHPLFALYGGLRTTTSNRHSTPTEHIGKQASLEVRIIFPLIVGS